MNEGCVVMGRPYPSHPFTTPHPIIYEIVRVTWEKTSNEWNFSGWKINVCKMKGLICSSHHMGAFVWDLRFQEGSRWSFYERISIGNIGNLQNLTQMLTYNRLIFISFPGWSSKGAWSWWSWWLIPLVLLFIRGRSSIPPPLVGIISFCNSL